MENVWAVFAYVSTAVFVTWAVIGYRRASRLLESIREDTEVAMLDSWWDLPTYEKAS